MFNKFGNVASLNLFVHSHLHIHMEYNFNMIILIFNVKHHNGHGQTFKRYLDLKNISQIHSVEKKQV